MKSRVPKMWITVRLFRPISKDIATAFEKYASFNPSPLTLKSLTEFGKYYTDSVLL